MVTKVTAPVPTEAYTLDHFYHGVQSGDVQPRLITATPKLDEARASEALRAANIPVSAHYPSWALVRAPQDSQFLLARAGYTTSGDTLRHVVVVPVDALRPLAGNLDALGALLRLDEPALEPPAQTVTTLEPLALDPSPPDDAAQRRALLQLMSYARNRIDVIEGLLAGLVQGTQVVILKAPPDDAQRRTFLMGLLALLPPSVRYAVTFATHITAINQTGAQIRFMDAGMPLQEAVLFDWSTGKLGGRTVRDDYSRFMVSQLRLDTGLALAKTRALTTVAAWRMRQGNRLAEALGYAAYRMRLDDSVVNSQPAGVDEVARVLASDPTLDETLRTAYGRHLLAFGLALGELDTIEPLGALLRQNDELARGVLAQLQAAVERGQHEQVYRLLNRWLRDPLGPEGDAWVGIAHQAALTLLDARVEADDREGVRTLMADMRAASGVVGTARMAPSVVRRTLPLAQDDEGIARELFLLAMAHLPTQPLYNVLKVRAFLKQLPGVVSGYTDSLRTDTPVRPRALVDVAVPFQNEPERHLLVMRLAEIALAAGRSDLIDAAALGVLAQFATSPEGPRYAYSLRQIVALFEGDSRLATLEEGGPRSLAEILLALGDFPAAGALLVRFGRGLYANQPTVYNRLVQRLFAERTVPAADVPGALAAFAKANMPPLPRAFALAGALSGYPEDAALQEPAHALLSQLERDAQLVRQMPLDVPLAMVALFNTQRHGKNLARAAMVLAQAAAPELDKHAVVLARVYRQMLWDDRARAIGVELLRRAIREAEDGPADKAITVLGSRLGTSVQRTLEATLAMRRIVGPGGLLAFAQQLNAVAELLQNLVEVYSNSDRTPTVAALLSDLKSMGGNLASSERQAIAVGLLRAARALVQVGRQHRDVRGHDSSARVERLLAGTLNPASGLEVLYVMGGFFSQGKRLRIRLREQEPTHPLGTRSNTVFMNEVLSFNRLTSGLRRAFPPNEPVEVGVVDLRRELESLWMTLTPLDQGQVVRSLATDLQRLPYFVAFITSTGDARALGEDNPLAKRLDDTKARPRSALELMRYISGYFKALAG